MLTTRAGAAVLGPIVEEAHDRIIGNRDDEPIEVTGEQMIEIVRDQHAAEVRRRDLPIPVIGTLKTTAHDDRLADPDRRRAGGAGAAPGLITRPERRDVLRGLGEFGLAMAASMLVFGYLLPVQLMPAIDNGVWTNAIPRLALRTLPVVLGAPPSSGSAGRR